MKFACVVLAAFLAATPVMAAVNESFADPAQEARARALQKELRCLVCQGQSIDESNAELAADLRALVREHIAAGESDDQIKNYLVARYGAFILMQPPLRDDTYALWFAPGFLVLFGGAAIGLIVARARRRARTEAETGDLEAGN